MAVWAGVKTKSQQRGKIWGWFDKVFARTVPMKSRQTKKIVLPIILTFEDIICRVISVIKVLYYLNLELSFLYFEINFSKSMIEYNSPNKIIE